MCGCVGGKLKLVAFANTNVPAIFPGPSMVRKTPGMTSKSDITR